MPPIYISGSLAYDHIMNMPGLFRDYFVPDKLHNINVSFFVPDHEENFGGTAGNIAYNLALLGAKPSIIATAGSDFDWYKKHLEAMGILTDTIHTEATKSCSFAYVVNDNNNNQIAAFHPGAGGTPYGDWKPEKDALAIIAPGCLDDMRAFPDLYQGSGVRFMFDPGQVIPSLTADELRNGMTGAEAVFANDYEFSLIQTATGWGETDIVNVSKMLVITLGADGSRIVTKEGETLVPAVKVSDVKDPTGAGDAFRAGFLVGMKAGKSIKECAQLGSTVAAYAIEQIGTQKHSFDMTNLAARYKDAYSVTITL
ncbi:MAG: carbohydrate kinase family protein [Minisyncoccia bacterium]